MLNGRLGDGARITLRALTRGDEETFLRLRRDNAAWLAPWDPTTPEPAPSRSFADYVRALRRAARRGASLPFVIEVDRRLVGQITGTIQRGSYLSCGIGYWVERRSAGRGIAPMAVALVADYAFGELGLHRVELDIRPDNAPSLAVARKLQLRHEGVRRNLLHIDGAWRDHVAFALTADEVGPGGLVHRLNQEQHQSL
ncbi:MAG: GNAT family N-acetyltransferase [Nostocoides sp.]